MVNLMRYSSKRSVEYDLKQHYELREKYQEEIRNRIEYDGYIIKTTRNSSNSVYYSVRRPDESKYSYLGKDTNETISGIQELAFYRKAVSRIEINIKSMEDFLSVYKNTNAENINELLPLSYKLPHDSAILLTDREVTQWMTANQNFKKSKPVFDSAGLKITAFDGTKMRSRAEALHYEAFFIYNIPAIFELPYAINGDYLRPDFTVLDVFTMQQKMWEHLGNWFHDNIAKRNKYRADSIQRWDEYASIGFYPEVNLFLSFGSENNIFDIQALHRKITMLSVPPPSEEAINMLRRL